MLRQRAKHTDDLFLGDLQRAAEGMMGRAVCPCGAHEIATTEQQAAALRATDDLAAAVRHQVCTLRYVWVWNDEVVGPGIYDDRNAGCARDGAMSFRSRSALPK